MTQKRVARPKDGAAERPKRGGKVIASARLAQLDAMGEDEVFSKYIEHGSTIAMCRAIFAPHPDYPDAARYGTDELYRWLHAAEGRWQRWQVVRQTRAHIEADMVYDEAMIADKENATAQRVKVDALKWRAGVLNRQDYGPPSPTTNVAVGVQIGSAWLEALREVGRQ
jgi:hypothetical protein